MTADQSAGDRVNGGDPGPEGALPAESGADVASAEAADQEPLDGGRIEELPAGTYSERHRAQTASKLAFTFAWIFAGALAVHYAVFLVLSLFGSQDALSALTDMLNVWLPALTGIVSAAATYYFTRDR